jgi:thymidylate synthase (FAD)
MQVRKIWSIPDGDALVGYIARVSNPCNQGNPDSQKLIRYLMKHKHWSPFEMVGMCVEIECSMPIGEQILRHRSFSFQKFSFRYSDVKSLGLAPSYVRARKPGKTNRQSSSGSAGLVGSWLFAGAQRMIWHICLLSYQLSLLAGVPREQARFLLPGMLTTRMYVSGTVRSWIHYLGLRLAKDTQGEHRDIAKAIAAILCESYPEIYHAALNEGAIFPIAQKGEA